MSFALTGLAHYERLTVVQHFGDTVVHRGFRDDGLAVLVKTHAQAFPTDATRERLHREHDMTSATTHPHLARVVELVDLPSRAALVLADPGGATLATVLRSAPLHGDALVDIVIDVVEALAALHTAGVVHGAIDSEHVIVAPAGAVLIDLYDACRIGSLPRRGGAGANPAPEQRLRAAIAADPASDQYAVAAMLLAAAAHRNEELSEALHEVLRRATEPDLHRRFRSVLGLLRGLRAASRGGSSLERHRVGTVGDRSGADDIQDVALSWTVPTGLHGGQPAVAAVDAAINASVADGTSRLVVLRGVEGSGRSTLCAALCDQLSERGVVVGLGSFDTTGSDPPLRAPIEVMRQIVTQLLAAPESVLDAVRSELRSRLGDDAWLAVQLMPALGLLADPYASGPPPPPTGSGDELLRRSERAVIESIASIARHVPPVVMVFDDADCADEASLSTLHLLDRRPGLGAFVAVLAARPGRGTGLEPLLDRLTRHGVEVVTVDLGAWSVDDVCAVLAAGTGSRPEHVRELATAVWARSAGLPRAVLADVDGLIAGGHLGVDLEVGQWHWSEVALQGAVPTTLEVVAGERLAALDDRSRSIVVAATLCERAASPEVLSLALGIDVDELQALADHAIRARLLARRTSVDDSELLACADSGVRRAVLASLDEPSRQAIELSMARAKLASCERDDAGLPAPTDDQRFEIVRLYGSAQHLVTDPAEVRQLIDLCVDAARVAHRSAGYRLALGLQLRAIELSGPAAWSTDHDRMFELHVLAAEHALMYGQTSLVDDLVERAISSRPSALQRVRLLRVLSSRWWTEQDTVGGLTELRTLLRELGEPIPEAPTWVDVGRELVQTRVALAGREPEGFLRAPEMTDPRIRAVMDVIVRCTHLAYISEPVTQMLLALRGARLSARHGVSEGSGYFLVSYGLLCCAFRNDVERGLRFGRVGMQLAEETGGTNEAMVTFAYNSFVRHWGQPLASTIEPMLTEYRSTLAQRRRGYGLTGATFAVLHSVLAGRPLQGVEDLAAGCSDDLERLGERAFKTRVDVVRQAIADLRQGPGDDLLDGPLFSAPDWLAARARRGELAAIVHTLRAMVALCLGDRAAAADAVQAAAPLMRAAPGQAIVALHRFQQALTGIDAIGAATSTRDRARHRLQVERDIRWLRSWEAHGPTNVAHRVALLEALLAGVQGRVERAMERFERAVRLASEHDSLPDLAIAAERAAGFHDARGSARLARHYAALALDAWHAWGATAAAASLQRRRGDLVGSATHAGAPAIVEVHVEPRAHVPSTADTLAQAGLLAGQELEIREFLERMVEIVIRHAAADRAFLVLQSDDGLVVEAAATRSGEVVDVPVLGNRLPSSHPDLCLPALAYALRTREVLVVLDPASDRRFRSDERLRARAPRSMLCLPVGRPLGTNGVLVLESDAFAHAFEADGIEALRVLSTQAISAIEHARLSFDLSSLAGDVADLRATASELATQAETDPLTGVCNRTGLLAGFRAEMQAHRREHAASGDVADQQWGLLFCDLDGFKAVNDRHGHAAGDAVLVEVAERLRSVVRADDIVARVGGDEFVIVSIGSPASELLSIAERALSEVRRPIDIAGGVWVEVSASIGVARSTIPVLSGDEDLEAVLAAADDAMYRAKRDGKNQVAEQ